MSDHGQFWEDRYQDNRTPWDLGEVPSVLQEYPMREAPGDCLLNRSFRLEEDRLSRRAPTLSRRGALADLETD